HTVTVYHRGKNLLHISHSNIIEVIGDRKESFEQLSSGRYDAVIDTCGYLPADVQKSCTELRDVTDTYVFVSTISVYADTAADDMTEEYPCAMVDDPYSTELTGATYGALKYHCEQEVLSVFGDNAIIVRPGLIVGPYDPTDRFTYWVVRGASGGSMVVPNQFNKQVQFIDVRDLALFIQTLIEQRSAGTFNATSPASMFTVEELLNECTTHPIEHTTFVPMSDEFLLGHDVQPWMGLPLWIPDSEETRGFYKANVTKALESGLAIRPLAETVRDTYSWWQSYRAGSELRAGITQEKERELLHHVSTQSV
ncbi:MAG: epimerase, partial [Candidatus Kapabacteria bacterium]|nr:epimerase [Candidatus Kapabacteria bacterium]